jgi:HTH-type transcriptional regulator/antitoxin HigA
LTEKCDNEHGKLKQLDPVALLKSLMKEYQIKAVQLAKLFNVSEGLISDMLNYKKGSMNVIRILSSRFKMKQEAFNRPQELVSELKNAGTTHPKKVVHMGDYRKCAS